MHTLKGTAATLGVMPLSAFARDLEQSCKAAADPTQALARAPELARIVDASVSALRATIASLRAELAA